MLGLVLSKLLHNHSKNNSRYIL